MTHSYAFISQGKLYVSKSNQEPELVTSPFANQVLERHKAINDREAWKYSGPSGSMSCSGAMFAMNSQCLPPVHIVGASRGDNGEIFYCIQSDQVAGFFIQALSVRDEKRLAHNNKLSLSCLNYSPTLKLAICSIRNSTGSTSIAVVDPTDGQPRTITEGDVLDLNPSWVPNKGRTIVYQSSGIGRNNIGMMKAFAPSEILQLDLETGNQPVIAADAKHNLSHPKVDQQGNLYFIKSPHKLLNHNSLIKSLVDVFLIPYRLASALFGWINIFSIMYGGKPLSSQGSVKNRIPDAQKAVLSGNISAAYTETRLSGKEEAFLVPKNFTLMMTKPGEEPVVIAERVGCYDIAEAGEIFYSNGKNIFHLMNSTAQPEIVGKSLGVTDLDALK